MVAETIFFLFFMGFIGILFLFMVFLFIFWIWMIFDCANRSFKKSDDKIVWLLVVILVGFIGAIIYYFAIKIKSNNIRKEEKKWGRVK